MRIYLSEGSLMDINRLGNGDTEVNITCPPKTYHSTEEKLKDKQGIAQEALSALSKKGITNAGPGKHAKRNSVPQLGYFKATQLPEGQIRWDRIPPPFGNINYLPSENNYMVQEGDNLTKIAQDNNISLPELERINPQIKTPDLIYPGDVVNLPEKNAYNSYTWNPSMIQEPTNFPATATTYETFTPASPNGIIPDAAPPSIVNPDGTLTAPAITLLSLMSYVPANRLKTAQVKETGIEDLYVPWYSRDTPPYGGGITFNNTIHITENFYDNIGTYGEGSNGNDIYQWLALLSHEIGHLPQEDIFNRIGSGTPGYLLSFIPQYLLFGHDNAPLELMADMGYKNFDRFSKDVGSQNISSIFTNNNLSDNEKSHQIISLFQNYLDNRIRDIEIQKKNLDFKLAEDSQKIIDLNKKIEAIIFTNSKLSDNNQVISLFQMRFDTQIEELESERNNLELQKAGDVKRITDLNKNIEAIKNYKQKLEMQK